MVEQIDLSKLKGVEWLNGALELQKCAFRKNGPPDASLRIDRLKRLLAALEQNSHRIEEAMMSDFGFRSAHQSYFVEVVTTAKPIREAIKNVRKWMRPEKRKIEIAFAIAGGRAEIHYQPLGVVGCVSPWNFPFNLAFSPLASIFAAGNSAMLKPSSSTPACAELMAEIISESFDAEEVVVAPNADEFAAAFTRLPFDHLIYTGGGEVAKQIAASAANNLMPLTLELGGKSPVLIGRRANIKLAANRIMFGKFLNAGQICLAPDYLLVPESGLDEIVAALKAAIVKMAPKENGTKDYVSIINKNHKDRLLSYLAEANDQGVQTVSIDWLGGDVGEGENFVAPTLIIDPPDDLLVMQEEIFGPLLPIKTYKSFEEAISFINDRPNPLALYYFGDDRNERGIVMSRTQSGGVTINDVIMHYTMDDLPFGGVGASGMGSYHGVHGFKQFSHARSVYKQSGLDIGGMLRPPYDEKFRKIAKFLLKHG
ncbi:coniferyl aldehyde dehydrogenase [Hirschia baltica]|uniref:Aldehyde dehydrogenase n=1 Tax=Hirschia baltica (strain ATCC 49814 / DSM 5838 / IFAM 1418) TaxID=582402 RepID=C6XNX0_HIRBI|nr:coniferyl aldehyde dehydrogenase [Hirschia baltica]ACT60150.1 Aldehyde Dehydrogenase [Hirschia baltica ATCC 49814]